MRYILFAASAAIVALTLASTALNGWGWWTATAAPAAYIMVALAASSEVCGAALALFLPQASSDGEHARAFALRALLIGCVVFNGWSGHRALGSLDHGPSTVDAAEVERLLDRSIRDLERFEAVDLASPASVQAAQTGLAAGGWYDGAVDGLPGPATVAALAAAVGHHRAEIDRLTPALRDARSLGREALVANAIHFAVVLFIEAMKALGLWAIGAHKAGGRRPNHPHTDRDEAMSETLDRRVPVKTYLRNGRPVSGHFRRPRGGVKAPAE